MGILLIVLLFWKEVKVLEIVTAEEAGFCFGVKRALDIVNNTAKSFTNDSIYTLGPLIHNPQVVKKLENLGVKAIDTIHDIDEGVIIIRSHGVEPGIIEKARNKGLHIIDATCPFVKNAQKYAKLLTDDAYQTFIYGDHNHPEVKGIFGASNNRAHIISNLQDLLEYNLEEKVGFVAQTTQKPDDYNNIICSVLNKIKELKVYNTICNTTEIRQTRAVKLAAKVDVMIVIGGYNSANTNRLAEICSNTGTPTYHIEIADEINWEWIKGKEKVGITAGASTPDWLIKEVIEVMSEENKEIEVNEEIENNEEEVKETEVIEEEVIEEEEVETVEENNEEANEEINEEKEEEVQIKYSDNDIADLKKGQTVKGVVVEINESGVYVDVGYKTEGFIPLRELSNKNIDDPNKIINVDDEITVVILTLEDEEGNMILSKKKADYEQAWEEILEAYENEEIIEAEVSKEVKGGLVVDVGVRGFIPASHVAIGYVEDLNQYVGKKLKLKIIEVERENNNVVLSAKEVLEKERKQMKNETLDSLEKNQVLSGKVTKIVDFGAFIDLGGIEGLLHISEMSWGRIGHPSEVLEERQDIEVKVLGVDKDNERISLGLKQLLADPWEEFAEKHYEGEIVEGKITKIVDFGSFMEIEKGIEGLIHISQLSEKHVKTPDEIVTVGEEREAKIINIDPEQKRVGLSLKGLEEQEEKIVKNKTKSQKKSTSKSEEKNSSGSGATIGELVGDIFNEDNDD